MRFQDSVLTILDSAATDTATSLVVTAALSPYNNPPDPAGGLASLTLVDSLVSPTKIETVTYTGITGTGPYTLTGVTRGSPAFAWSAGSRVYQAVRTADILSETLTDKAAPVAADVLGLLDSAATFVLKKLTLDNLKTFIGNQLHLKGYTEEVVAPAISGGTLVINLALGSVFNVTHNANITSLSIINPPVSGKSGSFTLHLTQDATGGRTLAIPASCKTSGGIALTLTTTGSRKNKIVFDTLDGGTTWEMALVGKDYT